MRKALGSHLPPISPATAGSWHTINSHTIAFQPTGYGYGLGAQSTWPCPAACALVGGQAGSATAPATWTVPGGSTVRLQQLLAPLGYLPLTFNYAAPASALTAAEQEAAAVNPPKGTFSWRYAQHPRRAQELLAAGRVRHGDQGRAHGV